MVLQYLHSQPSVGVPIKSEPLSPISTLSMGLPVPRPRHDGERNRSNFVSLSKYHNLPYRDYHDYHDPFHYPHDIKSSRTPSLTPGPSEDDTHSRRSSMSLGYYDPIVDSLNKLRANGKIPLQPFETIIHHDRSSPASPASQSWEPLPIIQDKSKHQLISAQKTKRPPEAHQKKPHININYTIEELDYIRYHRVDLGEDWRHVEGHFDSMFPLEKHPEGRVTGGLQGVYYRQHKALPLIVNGQLQFMKNSHVAINGTMTRKQVDKHLYTLLYLYPERAMKYLWLPLDYRQRALDLNQERQAQMETARLEAKQRGTYVKKLPPDVKCGCCPAEDRERKPRRRPTPKRHLHLPNRRWANSRRWASKL